MGNHRTQCLDNIGNVGFEFLHRKMKLFDFRALITHKRCEYRVQGFGVPHVAACDPAALLKQNDFLGVFKNDVEIRIAYTEFFLYFHIKIVIRVFALPMSPVKAQRVFDRSVGSFLRACQCHFVHQHQIFRHTVCFQKIGKSPAHGSFVQRAAESFILLNPAVVMIYRLF